MVSAYEVGVYGFEGGREREGSKAPKDSCGGVEGNHEADEEGDDGEVVEGDVFVEGSDEESFYGES